MKDASVGNWCLAGGNETGFLPDKLLAFVVLLEFVSFVVQDSTLGVVVDVHGDSGERLGGWRGGGEGEEGEEGEKLERVSKGFLIANEKNKEGLTVV